MRYFLAAVVIATVSVFVPVACGNGPDLWPGDFVCNRDSECPAGKVCSAHYCMTACGKDTDCPVGWFCDRVCIAKAAADMARSDAPAPCGRSGQPCCIDRTGPFCIEGVCTANGCEGLDMARPPDL